MRYDLSPHVTSQRYIAHSNRCGFHADDEALCISEIISEMECFLSIGEPISRFESDPEYKRMNANGELRHFNPFCLNTFEPKNAAMVVRFYVHKPYRIMREHNHPWVREAYQYFWDRCDLTMKIDEYETLDSAMRAEFEKEIESMLMVRTWRLN
jgi:hypothetical protein